MPTGTVHTMWVARQSGDLDDDDDDDHEDNGECDQHTVSTWTDAQVQFLVSAETASAMHDMMLRCQGLARAREVSDM